MPGANMRLLTRLTFRMERPALLTRCAARGWYRPYGPPRFKSQCDPGCVDITLIGLLGMQMDSRFTQAQWMARTHCLSSTRQIPKLRLTYE